MTISTILAIAIPPLVGAMGAVILFLVIDRLVEIRRNRRAAAEQHRIAA